MQHCVLYVRGRRGLQQAHEHDQGRVIKGVTKEALMGNLQEEKERKKKQKKGGGEVIFLF